MKKQNMKVLSGSILSLLLALAMVFGMIQYAVSDAAAGVSSFNLYVTDKGGVDQLVGTWSYDSSNKTFRDSDGTEAPFVKTFSGGDVLCYSGKDNYIAPRMAVCTKGILFSDLKTYVANTTEIPLNDNATVKWGMGNLAWSYPYSFILNRYYYPSYCMNGTFNDAGKVEVPAALAIISYNQRNLAGSANQGWGSATTLTALNGGVEVPVAVDEATLAYAFNILTQGADDARSLRVFMGQRADSPGDLNLGKLSLYNASAAGFTPEYLSIATSVTYPGSAPATATVTFNDGYAKAAAGEAVSCTISDITPGYELDAVSISDANGGAVNFSETDGVYSFTMPDSAVAIDISLTVTYDSLTGLVKQVVTQKGIPNALINKLTAAQRAEAKGHLQDKADSIQEFVDLVNEQNGKCISPSDAATLIYLAGLL